MAAYHAALEERTRQRMPLQWAATQNNLAIVLQTLGERMKDRALLERAWEAAMGARSVYVDEAGQAWRAAGLNERLATIDKLHFQLRAGP